MANKRSKGIFGAVKANIHTKLILGMTMLAILPLTAVGVFINWWTSNDLLEQAGRSTQETASRTADMVMQQLTENIHMLEALAVSNEVQDKLREANSSYFGNDQQIYSDLLTEDRQWSSAASAYVTTGGFPGGGNSSGTELIRKIVDENANVSSRMLQGFKKKFPNHVEVFLTDKFGANVASTGVTSDYYQADEEWWQSAFRQGGGAVYLGKPALDKSASAIAMVIAVPVRNKTNEIIGILRSTLEVSEIRTLLENVRLGKTGRVVIADVDGNIIFDPIRQPDPDQKLPSEISVAKITQKNSPGWIEASSFNSEPAIVGYSRTQRESGLPALERLQWTAVAIIESEEALAPVADSTRFQLILGFMFALTAIATAFYLSSRFTAQIKLIMKLFNELRKGNYEMRAPVITRDELGEMTAGLNRMLDETLALHQTKREREQLQDSIMKLLNEVSKLAEGDLTVNAEVRADITGAIADAFNYMTGELREIISRVQNMSVQVGVSVKETGEITERLAEAGEAQAKRILAAKDEVEAMADAMRRISETALACKSVAQQSLSTARLGTEAVRESMDGMIGIREHVLETSKRIKRLGEQSQEIGEIVQLISDIAYRTGVLALNASIQAARAGESGRGFAVVAEEVEQLAKRSTEATRNIGDLVKSIQLGTHEAVTAMEESTREVVEGSRRADMAGRALSEIEKVSAQLSDLIQSISVAAELQAQGSGDVSRTMITLSETTQSTAFDIKQSASSVNGLVVLANDLRASVASFKLPVNGNGSF